MVLLKWLVNVLMYIWQLPQNLCGLIYLILPQSRISKVKGNKDANSLKASVHLQDQRGGVTLGRYIFIYRNDYNLEWTIKHECGHVKQSRILGPLYLFVIGIPSIVHAALPCKRCKTEGYYHFYTEKWSNKLMGINK